MKISKLILLFIFLFTTGCSKKYKTLEEIIKSNEIVVTTNAEFAPFEYKEGSEIKGIDIDIIKEYGKFIDVDVKIVDTDFDSALISVALNKSDLAIAGITKNKKREEAFSFSNSYYNASQVIIVKNDSEYINLKSQEEVLNKLSLNNARIGCQRGTVGQYFIEGSVDWEFEGIKNTKCIIFDNGALAASSLSNNQIDALIIDEMPASLYCKKFSNIKTLDFILTEEEYAIAVTKGNIDLVNSLNEFIKNMKGNGTIDSIIGKYYGE